MAREAIPVVAVTAIESGSFVFKSSRMIALRRTDLPAPEMVSKQLGHRTLWTPTCGAGKENIFPPQHNLEDFVLLF
jgi:hypothetical protein